MAKKKRGRWRVIRTIVVFLAGVAVGVYFFAPEKPSLKTLWNKETRQQALNLEEAGRRAQDAKNMMSFYAAKAKDYVDDRLESVPR